jgi:hypothetical protein
MQINNAILGGLFLTFSPNDAVAHITLRVTAADVKHPMKQN